MLYFIRFSKNDDKNISKNKEIKATKKPALENWNPYEKLIWSLILIQDFHLIILNHCKLFI